MPQEVENQCRVTREISYQALVIPAEAGIQKHRSSQKYWIPAFAGMTAIFATLHR